MWWKGVNYEITKEKQRLDQEIHSITASEEDSLEHFLLSEWWSRPNVSGLKKSFFKA